MYNDRQSVLGKLKYSKSRNFHYSRVFHLANIGQKILETASKTIVKYFISGVLSPVNTMELNAFHKK